MILFLYTYPHIFIKIYHLHNKYNIRIYNNAFMIINIRIIKENLFEFIMKTLKSYCVYEGG